MFCKSCGNDIGNNAICPNCGAMCTNEIKDTKKDDVNIGLIILSVLFPLFGFIYGAVIWNESKAAAKKYLLAAGISVALEIFLCLLCYLIPLIFILSV